MLDLLKSPLAFIFAASGMWAQPSPARPAFDEFEVATIKPTPLDHQSGRYIRMDSAHVLKAKNHTLKTLIMAAYNLTSRAVSGGPDWVDSEHFDIVAKAPNDARPNLEEQMAMLRKLLADRFQLTFHREDKELSLYTLTVAKGGLKLKESAPAADAPPPPPLIFVLSPQSASLPGRNATMAELASVIQRAALDRPVVDKTGLSGRYDFNLEWAPDDTQFGGAIREGDPSKPDLFNAVQQQLGLKLEASKGPVAVLIIDHAQKPSDN